MTLFDAARLSLRSRAGPFRSLGRISVVPRPYQFVPLIMSLRQSPVRLLIADDVGVGKTIEAAMIARELLDRGLARRLAVLCPAHLCDQWERALREKFAIVLVQPAQMRRLEGGLPRPDISVYQHYANIVASIDFVKSSSKSSSQRDRFLAAAPDLVIIRMRRTRRHARAAPRRAPTTGVTNCCEPSPAIRTGTFFSSRRRRTAASRRASARYWGCSIQAPIGIPPNHSIARPSSPTSSNGDGAMSRNGSARRPPFLNRGGAL
jgi:hypothetical protein